MIYGLFHTNKQIGPNTNKKGVEYDYSKLLLDDTDLWIATVLNSPEPYNYGIGHE